MLTKRKLGRQGLEVSAIRPGCFGMSRVDGPADDGESIATIQRLLALAVRPPDVVADGRYDHRNMSFTDR